MLKNKCFKALNILNILSSTDQNWITDVSFTVIPLHRISVLNTVHHQGLRLSFVAFRTSPVESLHVKENEPFHENRRIKLGMQYATKLKAYPSNPAKTVFLILYMKMLTINNPIQFNLLDFE